MRREKNLTIRQFDNLKIGSMQAPAEREDYASVKVGSSSTLCWCSLKVEENFCHEDTKVRRVFCHEAQQCDRPCA